MEGVALCRPMLHEIFTDYLKDSAEKVGGTGVLACYWQQERRTWPFWRAQGFLATCWMCVAQAGKISVLHEEVPWTVCFVVCLPFVVHPQQPGSFPRMIL